MKRTMLLTGMAILVTVFLVGCSATSAPVNAMLTAATSTIPATPSPSLMPTASPEPTPAATTPAPTLQSFKPVTKPPIDPQTVIVFEDKEMDRLLHRAFGLEKNQDITKQQLDTITGLMIVGRYISIGTNGKVMGDEFTSFTKFGVEYEVNGKFTREVGIITTLNDLTKFDELVSIEIWYQKGMDISAVSKIRRYPLNLTLSNCNIKDISVLSQMRDKLGYLDLTNNPIEDYSPLDSLIFTEMHKDKWTLK